MSYLHPMDDVTGFEDEQEVHDWLLYRSIGLQDAIDILVSKWGYRPDEAKRIVSEWTEDAEDEDTDND